MFSIFSEKSVVTIAGIPANLSIFVKILLEKSIKMKDKPLSDIILAMSASNSLTDTPIFSFPKRSATSFIMTILDSFLSSNIAALAPAYRYFLTSSTLLTLPPTKTGVSIDLVITLIMLIASSWDASS